MPCELDVSCPPEDPAPAAHAHLTSSARVPDLHGQRNSSLMVRRSRAGGPHHKRMICAAGQDEFMDRPRAHSRQPGRLPAVQAGLLTCRNYCCLGSRLPSGGPGGRDPHEVAAASRKIAAEPTAWRSMVVGEYPSVSAMTATGASFVSSCRVGCHGGSRSPRGKRAPPALPLRVSGREMSEAPA